MPRGDGQWVPLRTELVPPDLVTVRRAVVEVATLTHLDVEWRVDAVLTTAHWHSPGALCLPGLLLRPAVHHDLDDALILESFDGWAVSLRHAPSGAAEGVARRFPLPGLHDVRRGPDRRPEPVRLESVSYWANRAMLIAQASRLASEPADLDDLLLDYPFVVASLPRLRRTWDRTRPRLAPSPDDSLDHVHPQPVRPGPQRRVGLPDLAVQLYWVLSGASGFRSAGWDELARRLGVPPKQWWAQAVAEGGARFDRGFLSRARTLKDRADACRRGLSTGRTGTPGRADVRRIVPYLLPDLAVYPRGEPTRGQELPLDGWLEGPSFQRLLRIVTGRDLARLEPAGPSGLVEDAIHAATQRDRLALREGRPTGPAHDAAIAHVRSHLEGLALGIVEPVPSPL